MLYGIGPWCCACCCWASLLLLVLLGMDMGGSSTTWDNKEHTTPRHSTYNTAQYMLGVGLIERQAHLQQTGQYTTVRQTQYA